MSTFWLAVKDWLEAVSYCCAIFGIIFAIFEYLDFIEANRQQAAVSLIQQFQDEEISGSRLKLHQDWLNYPIREISGLVGSSDVIDDLALSFVFPTPGKQRTDDLVRVVDFLDLAGICVREEICDRAIMTTHIGNYVRNLNCLYRAPLQRLRTRYNLVDFGIPMRELIGAEQSC